MKFIWCTLEQTIEQAGELAVICDTKMLVWRHCDAIIYCLLEDDNPKPDAANTGIW